MTTDVLTDVVLPRLDGVTQRGNYYMARCPAHDDHRASMSVERGRDHPVVLHCHAGCDPKDIADALGVPWDALCAPRDEDRHHRTEWTPRGDAVAVYDYYDEQGTLLYQVLRTITKEFPTRVPDPTQKSGYRWRLGDTRRVLYRLPQTLAAAAAGRTVYVVEGEKDADALAARGHAATCNPGGAGKWRAEYAGALRGADVVIVADNDQPNTRGNRPGLDHARQVAASLEGAAATVRVVQARTGKDAADHLSAGHDVSEFVPLDLATGTPVETSQDVSPVPETPRDEPTGDPVQDRAAQIRAALLDSEGMDALPPPAPLIDGVLYLDSLSWLHGKPGHGKSFVALDWAAHIASGIAWQDRDTTRGPVLYLVAEGTSGMAERKRAWEAEHGHRMDVIFLPMAVQFMSPTDATRSLGSSRSCALSWSSSTPRPG
ncbi:hypothetical protein BJF83_17420 [Nocardiopsis sp. CNR-923]|nr:AAA family ATPase [Nocardiopsis sp. CNR-923]OLT27763.1 hypothetical protein BJF83_17420 [Nocardiopsis sp. CNR-923]